ncbi:MAG: glycosyltransferase [Maritimibacter sp.]|nr:glycosyltransferase [Maritimibacter sp.]
MRQERTDTGRKSDAISVIVPVYRQWDLVADFLAAWSRQTLPRAAELILVNNDPAAPPESLALPSGARIVDCAAPGSYAARNVGAEVATGDWLVFTDADCRPLPGWLDGLARAMDEAPQSLLAGDVAMVIDGAATPWARFDLVRGIPQARYVTRGYGATANLAVPADLFRRLSGFDARRLSGGDAEFCRRAGATGTGIHFVPDAIVAHPARADWASLKTKARRVKGAQLTQGGWRQRGYWLARTLLPPVHEVYFYLRSPHPLGDRLIACLVRARLWGVELAETARLMLAGASPERR